MVETKTLKNLSDLKEYIPEEQAEQNSESNNNTVLQIESDVSVQQVESQERPVSKETFDEMMGNLGIDYYDNSLRTGTERSQSQYLNPESKEVLRVENIFTGSIQSYILGSSMFNDLKVNKDLTNKAEVNLFKSCISKDEVDILMYIKEHSDVININQNDKNIILAQIHSNIIERKKNREFISDPSKRLNNESVANLMHCLKTEYIMDINEVSKRFIDLCQNDLDGGIKNDIFVSKAGIKSAINSEVLTMLSDGNYSQKAPNTYIPKDKTERVQFEGLIEEDINTRILSGMRNEKSFEKVFLDIASKDHSIGFCLDEDSDKQKDSRGIDFYLSVKVSKLKKDGKYVYASPDEIARDEFESIKLPIDLKSSPKGVQDGWDQQLRISRIKNKKPDHWVMWSHIYPEDYKLPDDSREFSRAETFYLKGKGTVLLKDSQINNMKKLDIVNESTRFDRERASWVKENLYAHRQGQPVTFSGRVTGIKKDIIDGVNTLFVSNESNSAA